MSNEPESTTPAEPGTEHLPNGKGNPSAEGGRQSFKVGQRPPQSVPAVSREPAKLESSSAPLSINLPVDNSPESSTSSGPGDKTEHPKMLRGKRPGDRYVRVMRTTQADVQRLAPKFVQLKEEDLADHSAYKRFKRFLIGRPIATAHSGHERIGVIKALAIFSSDALSSVAYATEASMFVLVTVMMSANPIQYIIPISIVICVLIALVVNSYRQTVHAYPAGGGSYIVSKDNLGTGPGLIAAAAILIDYTLTVAVSVSAGVLAITSAFPALNGSQVLIGVGVIFLLTLGNLRGIRESGSIFAVPTYIFIVSFLGMLLFGVFKVLTGDFTPAPQDPIRQATTEIPDFSTHPLSIFILLQAFAAGCSALTGVEAISDGVQAFKKPEPRNAAKTLIIMGSLLIIFFLGTSFLALQLHALPDDSNSPTYETIISEIGRNLFGGSSPFYFLIQFSTALILILAANTAFADFPRLASFLARDKFLPNLFAYRGDRLAFTTGIIVLAVLASILLAIFNGHTESLIPLYAVGVFLAFTLSQTGMVVHWQRKKRAGMQGVTRAQIFNVVGAIATGMVLVVIVVTKFLVGAWLVVILIPLLYMMFKAINRHYTKVSEDLRVPAEGKASVLARNLPVNGERTRKIIVPIASINKASLATLDFARSLGEDVTALFISDEPEAIEQMTQKWKTYDLSMPLVILENPYRSILPPLLNYLDSVDKEDPNDILLVVLPEFVSRHWWEQLLHNQTAFRIKSSLLFREGVVVIDVPYHMPRRNK